MNELESLQNCANLIGAKVHLWNESDKRKTCNKYFLQVENETVSPKLDYEQLNHFMLGWIRSEKHLTKKYHENFN
jgi:hypothetical protein